MWQRIAHRATAASAASAASAPAAARAIIPATHARLLSHSVGVAAAVASSPAAAASTALPLSALPAAVRALTRSHLARAQTQAAGSSATEQELGGLAAIRISISPREARRARAIAARYAQAAAAASDASASSPSDAQSSPPPPPPPPSSTTPTALEIETGQYGGPRLHPGVHTRDLKPSELVRELDRFIIGQSEAKKAVAIALRNRWRRHRLPEELRQEVMPKNILMIGPTGCGKTEIARRLAKLTESPFLKVEATKFTEVGFHGKDVDSIVGDLVRVAIAALKARRKVEARAAIQRAVQDKILEALIADGSSFESWRPMLERGELEGVEIDIEVPIKDPSSAVDEREGGREGAATRAAQQHEAFQALYRQLTHSMSGKRTEHRKLTISEARPLLEESHMDSLFRPEDLVKDALKAVAEDGIVFIDEIDKICSGSSAEGGGGGGRSADASAEGVQRDLLPLIEGTTVSTKQGEVSTDHILFIASGAFHAVKPSDLLAELQGRLPIRVELTALTEEELYRILSHTENSLVQQQVELLAVDRIKLVWKDEAVREIARVACEVNRSVENIGARRLNTVIERIVDDISYNAADLPPDTECVIDRDFVRGKVGELLKTTDLGKFML